jgi:hypothetical protein
MRKPLIALVAIGLVAGAIAAPAQAAKKKKPKPKPPAAPVQADQKYYLVNLNDGDCAEEGMLLMLDQIDVGGGCGSLFGGPANTAFDAATGDVCTPDTPVQSPVCGTISHHAGEGLPVALDATKKITGTIFISSYTGASENPAGLGVGAATFNMRLSGTVNGEEKELGTFSAEYTVTPDKQVYEVPFEIALDAALDKAELSTLVMDLWNTGPAAVHGFYETNTSNVVLPIWKAAS